MGVVVHINKRRIFQLGKFLRGFRRQRKFDIDRRINLLLIFDLGLGQRGLAAGAPQHGTQSLINEILADQRGEDADRLASYAGIEG